MPPSRRPNTLPLFSLCLTLATGVNAIHRTIGAPSDHDVQNTAHQCGSLNKESWKAGQCSLLVNCVLDGISSVTQAGFNSGTNIAALVPTAMALIGAPPLDIVQLAFLAPHRALAISLFGVGLPSGLFRQLTPALSSLREGSHPHLPRCVREWRHPVPASRGFGLTHGGVLVTLLADFLILALSGVMLWRNLVVCYETVVSWRCEWFILLFCWPMAGIVWLAIAISLLGFFSSSVQIRFSSDRPGTNRGILSLITLPYRAGVRRSLEESKQDAAGQAGQAGNDLIDDQAARSRKANRSWPLTPASPDVASIPVDGRELHRTDTTTDATFILRIEMPSEKGLYSWRFYEACIETLAVGLYLYATFVLTSVLFLSGEEAIIYACVLILSEACVRLLSLVF